MKVVNSEGDDWDLLVDPILFGYRVSMQSSTKFSPFELLYGVKAKLPIDLVGEKESEDEDLSQTPIEERVERVRQLAEDLVAVRDKASENLKEAQSKQKTNFDLKHAPPTYAVGDHVLKYDRRRDTRMGDKLKPRYTGPFRVEQIIGRGVYRLRDGDRVLKQCVNANNLKAYIEPTSPSQSTQNRQNPSQSPQNRQIPSQSPQTKQKSSQSPKTRQNPSHSPRNCANPWLPSLNLIMEDRDILRSGGWLNDRLVDAINNMVSEFVGGQTAQTSLLAQGADGFLPTQHETMRIVYDNHHWVAAAIVDGEVLVANSLGTLISPLVIAQLKQLFPGGVEQDGSFPVTVIECAQQPNGSDCGVFAAAFLFEWATLSVKTDLNVRYKVKDMRDHLETCLTQGKIQEFPKIRAGRAFQSTTKKLVF